MVLGIFLASARRSTPPASASIAPERRKFDSVRVAGEFLIADHREVPAELVDRIAHRRPWAAALGASLAAARAEDRRLGVIVGGQRREVSAQHARGALAQHADRRGKRAARAWRACPACRSPPIRSWCARAKITSRGRRQSVWRWLGTRCRLSCGPSRRFHPGQRKRIAEHHADGETVAELAVSCEVGEVAV
jgi:hypothetical protein